MQETIEVDKGVIKKMVDDIEDLLDNMEMIVEKKSMAKIQKRLNDVKTGKVDALSEEDFDDFMREEGIDG
jgi:hypothetical protein